MIVYCATYYVLGILGVNLGYHRMLAHRAVRLPKWLARFCVLLGLPAGTPVQWVGNHRFHHAHADTAIDSHSPCRDGFWYAHCGWYHGWRSAPICVCFALAGPLRLLIDAWLQPSSGNCHNTLAADITADAFLSRLSQPWTYCLLLHLHAALALAIPFAYWGSNGLLLAWGTWVAVYNLGDAINSLTHDRTGPVNRRWLAFLTAGEGWHANHHRHPGSPRHGVAGGQLDITWQIIRLLALAGWATVENKHGSA